jgi:hypothetical protein
LAVVAPAVVAAAVVAVGSFSECALIVSSPLYARDGKAASPRFTIVLGS